MKPLFTVIIPCFNAEKTLLKTLDSVLNQSLDDWEIIIIDDGSTDESLKIIAQMAKLDRRIRFISQSNQGVSAARNLGVRLSLGRYLAFLDADDAWHPDKLQRHAEHFAQFPKLGVSFARVQFMSPSGHPLMQYSFVPNTALSAFSLLTENHISTSSNIVARKEIFKVLGGFAEDMSFAEDQEWLFRIAIQNCWTILGIAETLVYYRTGLNSLSASLNHMEKGWLAMLEKASHYAPTFIAYHKKSAQAIYFRYLARRALRQGIKPTIGLHYLYKAWKADAFALLNQPQRSLLTLCGLLAWWAFPGFTNRFFLHL